jgi:hypothetical protein
MGFLKYVVALLRRGADCGNFQSALGSTPGRALTPSLKLNRNRGKIFAFVCPRGNEVLMLESATGFIGIEISKTEKEQH